MSIPFLCFWIVPSFGHLFILSQVLVIHAFDNYGGWQELGPMFDEQKQRLEEDLQPVLASAALELSKNEAANNYGSFSYLALSP